MLALRKPIEADDRATAENCRRLRELLLQVRWLATTVPIVEQEKAARKAAEQRADALQLKVDRLTQENRRLREGRWETEEFLHKSIRSLQVKVNQLTDSLEKAHQTIAWFTKDKFARESEASKIHKAASETAQPNTPADGSPEANPTDDGGGTEEKPKRKRGQQPGSEGHPRSDRTALSDTPVVLEIENCACPLCFKPYFELPETDDSRMVAISICLFQYFYQRKRYVAQCTCQGKKLVTAPPPPRLYPGTTLHNTMWVYLAVMKYLNGEPPNRTLKHLSLSGLPLSAGTVVGGFQVIATLLDPLYEAIVTRCQGADLWNADETTQPVFEDDEGNRNKKRWWIWVIASDDAVVYILDRSRSKEVPSEFFGGSRGVLMTDRLASYKALHDAIQKAWCWVHQRRDFIKIYDGNPRLKSWAKEWMLAITILFLLNHKRLKLWQDGKTGSTAWNQAQDAVEEHIQKLKAKWEEELRLPDLHKEQKKALRSLQKHWDGLTIFLLDPRIPLDNNRAERLLKGLVINRKNSFGCGKEWAGHMNAKFHTIFQTWLVNGLNPEALLLDYFNECSKTSGRPPPDLSQFLPWTMSEERKQAFTLPKSYKRPA